VTWILGMGRPAVGAAVVLSMRLMPRTRRYDGTEIGTESLSTTANEDLISQNQDGPNDACPSCNGPLTCPSTTRLKTVSV
jgi:hypothetical protein